MAYDAAFFEAYRRYLHEPTVRRSHDAALRTFAENAWRNGGDAQLRVLDLGCGSGEYHDFGVHSDYVGIDVVPRFTNAKTLAGSYISAQARSTWRPALPFVPNAFVSLFSIEPVLDAASRYYLYANLFREFPSLSYGLSAGFYYASKPTDPFVQETGGIVSNQTIDMLGQHDLDGIDEERLVMRTPSKMFGNDVVEVWKLFTRQR